MTEAKNKTSDLGLEEAEKQLKSEQDKGLRGVEVDQTPNENYSVTGVTSGKPTPETSQEA